MTNRPFDMPDFSNPPVVETVLSVQFERLAAAHSAHFGLYWKEILDRFPKTEERSELPLVFEKERELPPPDVGIQLQALDAPPIPRFWFMDKDGDELIQVQRDRFIKNWRKADNAHPYPRYEKIREAFERDFATFKDFAGRHSLGDLCINQCEVTYVNQIVAGKGWKTHADADKIFTVWRQPTASFPGSAQDAMFRARFPIADSRGAFAGRLHVAMQPAFRPTDGAPMFVLELTARGQVGAGMEFFDLGREWIVRSFKGLTTSEMHQIWGMTN